MTCNQPTESCMYFLANIPHVLKKGVRSGFGFLFPPFFCLDGRKPQMHDDPKDYFLLYLSLSEDN